MYQDPHYYHLLPWIQIPHHTGKAKNITIQDVCCFCGIFSQIDLSLYCIIPFVHASIALPETCKQIKAGMHFIDLWFAELLTFSPDCV